MIVVCIMEFDSDWNWKVLVENFMEVYYYIVMYFGILELVFYVKEF